MAPLALLIATLSAMATKSHAKCGQEIPKEPQCGKSELVSIRVEDPNLGEVGRSFTLHIPAGYSAANDVEVPLVLDFHAFLGFGFAWGMDDVADKDPDGGFITAHMNGFGEPSFGPFSVKNWNTSRDDGPLGPPCVLPRPILFPSFCYKTCNTCNSLISYKTCDHSSCYDDVNFARAVIDYVRENYCLDMNSIHLMGFSVGGTFTYYAASRLNDVIASIAPNAASPMIGHGEAPLEPPLSLIDFHGQRDTVIPFDADRPGSKGKGPHNSLISSNYYYYEQKPDTIARWVEQMECGSPEKYTTEMDGVDEWSCRVWPDCKGGKEVVQCTGSHGHDYPFHGQRPRRHAGAFRIAWDFMKRHRKT